MQLGENIRMAFTSLKTNKLRSFFTLLGIIIGVFSIIGVMTAIGILNNSINTSLSQLGSSTFTVKKFPSIHTGAGEWIKYARRKPVSLEQIQYVRSFTTLPIAVSAEHNTAPLTVSYGNTKSDPQYFLFGSDENYALNHNFTIQDGRMLTGQDVEYARDVCVLADDIVQQIFGKSSAIGKTVRLNSRPYVVVGTFEKKGSGGGQSQDNFALVPVTNEQKYFVDEQVSLVMTVKARTQESLEATKDEVIAALRSARGVKPGVDNDFEVEDNTSLIGQLDDFKTYTTYAGFGISAIALLAASIGIMNIMLVSVTERTKEIGIRKALGATRADITSQFLMEAIVLCEVGGIIGILLGILLGNGVAIFLKTDVYIPFVWVGVGLGVCSFVGIVFGLYPARKAARMDPIDALRFE